VRPTFNPSVSSSSSRSSESISQPSSSSSSSSGIGRLTEGLRFGYFRPTEIGRS
jgi:hypothetical protein